MISDKDIYADKDGKLTTDPDKYAFQVAVAGVEVSDRVAKRYGIEDSLVSVYEPNAVRHVRGGKASVQIVEADEDKEPQEPAVAEPEEAKQSKASVKVVKARKGEKK